MSEAASGGATHLTIPQLSCPGGCEFRVQALHLDGWAFSSVASAVVATPTLAPPAVGAIRLEVRLLPSALTQSGGVDMLGGLLLRDIAAATREEVGSTSGCS